MQRPPSAATPPLSPVISSIPLSTRRRSSLLSTSSGPHTPPPSRHPNLPVLSMASSNRNSTDSWNSSNYDGAEDLQWEWRPEQTRLLLRTLDALPAHLLTPFNGAIPPSNLLDKIARGVSQAKGPLEWPHSMRATRAKIVELARMRAREALNESASDTIAEEDSTDSDALQQAKNIGTKRPLYRQSSMDFMQSAKLDLKDNSNLIRLSHRLQRTDRTISTSPYHPHAYNSSRSPSPSRGNLTRGPFLPSFGASTPSSTTLNSDISGSRIPRLRRSMSSVSSSDSYGQPVVDPRLQRIKRTESYCTPAHSPTHALKRAPSFGAGSRRSSGAMSIDLSNRDSDVTSDEEEKLRSLRAKRSRLKASSPIAPPVVLPLPSSPEKSKTQKKQGKSTTIKPAKIGTPDSPMKVDSPRRPIRARATIQRNPSILGGELPQPQPDLLPPALRSSPAPKSHKRTRSNGSPASQNQTQTSGTLQSAYSLSQIPSITPHHSPGRALRRTKGADHLRGGLGRKISFGSIMPSHDDENVGAVSGAGLGLGSAFQLR